jgi:hypothetical protein
VRALGRRVARLERAAAPPPSVAGLTDQQWLAALRALRMRAELAAAAGEDGYGELARRLGLGRAAVEARIAELERRLGEGTGRG